jgi:death-on-curing protein
LSLFAVPEKLDAAVARPQASVFGEDAYPSLAEKAAALLESLVIGHAFVDGNKRIGFAAMATFLKLNGVARTPPEDPTYDLVLSVASGESGGVDEIAEQLRILFAPDLQ